MSVRSFPFSPPERAFQPPYVQWAAPQPFLSPPECEVLRRLGESKPLGAGLIGNGTNDGFRLDPGYRHVQTRALTIDEGLGWLYERIRDRVMAVNEQHYRFDLTGIEEGIQFLRYDAPASDDVPPGHYNWHQDFGGGRSSLRKLSLVIQLSEPRHYQGGRLRLFTDCDFEPQGPSGAPLINEGEAVLFPSWTPHMVAPVTAGLRYSLAAWVCGPQFR